MSYFFCIFSDVQLMSLFQDMLLIGNDCVNDDEARTQMAIWSIIAAPLIMGNDARNVSDSARAILVNKDAIAVNQDIKGEQGLRLRTKREEERQR